MAHLTHKRIVAFAIAAALAVSVATPSFAKTPPAQTPYGDYNKFKSCSTANKTGSSKHPKR